MGFFIRKPPARYYTPKEAHTLFKMMMCVGSRELAIQIIHNSRKKFFEPDRRQLYRELSILLHQLRRWHYIQGNNRLVPYHIAYTDEQLLLLEEIKKIRWQHSARTYAEADWQKNNRKKEYRRSAKNHYS